MRSILAAIALALAITDASAQPIRVIDGDTIERDGIRWRLMGFDAPETFRAKCLPEYALGMRATRTLAALLAGRKHEIVDSGRRDRYGRHLGTLIIDGRDAADLMIEAGMARPYTGRTKRQSWCD